MAKSHYRCAVVGDWHLAFITAACLSELGHKTLLVNPLNSERWEAFPELKLNEPGLAEILTRSRAEGRIDFANGVNPGEAPWTADFVWLAIDTPVNERDEADLDPLLRVARQIKEGPNSHAPFVVTSQIPLGFCRRLEKEFGLITAYVPENLRLGKGIETFLKADRFVIGSDHLEVRDKVNALLKALPADFLLCDSVTSEMVKHATNAFLATSISFANELARVGERMGVDSQAVGQALKLDKRIGKQAYVAPGLGFAGGTLPRDLRILQKIGKEHGVATELVDAVLEVNDSTGLALVKILSDYLGGLEGRRVLVVGYTYKAETDTLRRSPSLELAGHLKKAGAKVHGFDPIMDNRDLSPLQGLIEHQPTWGADLPDAVIVMTPRKEFVSLDWGALPKLKMTDHTRRTLVFDTTSVVDGTRVLSAGLAYKALWKPARMAP